MAVNDFKQYTVSVYEEQECSNLEECVLGKWQGDIITPIAVVLNKLMNKEKVGKLVIECALKRRITAEMWVARIKKYIQLNSSEITKQLTAKKTVGKRIDCDKLCDLLFDRSVNVGIEYNETKDNLQIMVTFSDDVIKKIRRYVVL